MDSVVLSALLASQSSLVQEAAEALPHQFSQCTYLLGSIRQAVYLCRTCNSRRGICSACSIACHTDHEQLELFPKRNFRCDCPTTSLSHNCTLHTSLEDPNASNEYGQNFNGVFCRCGREYDPQQERETMIQCLACEDWFHESCLNLRERPSSREPTPENVSPGNEAKNIPEEDALSEASSSDLPPPLIAASDYESLVCAGCVHKIETLKRYAGTPGILMAIRDDREQAWRIIGKTASEDENVDVGADDMAASSATGAKRERSSSVGEGPQTKRVRASSVLAGDLNGSGVQESILPTCLAPALNALAQRVLSNVHNNLGRSETTPQGAGDVFLTDGFRKRWCRCNACLPSLQAHPYLLEEEETYEPPEDPDSGLSLEELGLRALESIPRERAINGIHAFNEMRDQLLKHLRPIANQNREVTADDIHAFFEEARQAHSQNSKSQ